MVEFVSPIRKHRKMNAGVQLACLYIVNQSAAHGMLLPVFRMGLPPSVKPLSRTHSEDCLLGDPKSN